jgi:hypothetical protein
MAQYLRGDDPLAVEPPLVVEVPCLALQPDPQMQASLPGIGDDVSYIGSPEIEHSNAAFSQPLGLGNSWHKFPGIFPAFAFRWQLKSA